VRGRAGEGYDMRVKREKNMTKNKSENCYLRNRTQFTMKIFYITAIYTRTIITVCTHAQRNIMNRYTAEAGTYHFMFNVLYVQTLTVLFFVRPHRSSFLQSSFM